MKDLLLTPLLKDNFIGMLKNIFKVTLIVTIVIFTRTLIAQPPTPGGDPDSPDNPVPITGLEYLIAAGAAFGAKKVYDKRKKNAE